MSECTKCWWKSRLQKIVLFKARTENEPAGCKYINKMNHLPWFCNPHFFDSCSFGSRFYQRYFMDSWLALSAFLSKASSWSCFVWRLWRGEKTSSWPKVFSSFVCCALDVRRLSAFFSNCHRSTLMSVETTNKPTATKTLQSLALLSVVQLEMAQCVCVWGRGAKTAKTPLYLDFLS